MPKGEYKWTEETAIQTVIRNGMRVGRHPKVIDFGRIKPGIRLWSALDYLAKYCGYLLVKGD